MNIAVIGTAGYVGLVTAASLADDGHTVVGVDINEKAIRRLQEGQMPFYEAGLDSLVLSNLRSQRLRFTTDLGEALTRAKLAFITVGTPPQEDGFYNMGAAYSVAKDIGDLVNNELFVVMKSTVNIGEHRNIKRIIEERMQERGVTVPLHYISNPEFLAQGSAVHDAQHPDRVVVGVEDEESLELMKELYASKTQSGAPLIHMGPREAEIVKLGANSFLAMKITFANELAKLCDKVGANVYNVRSGIVADKRINPQMTHPGPGYAGSCFPKDTQAFARQARALGSPVSLIEQTIISNSAMRDYMGERILEHYQGNVKGRQFAILGLSFKPKTDDVRDTATSDVVQALASHGARIIAYDAHAMEAARQKEWGRNLMYASDAWAAIDGSDAVVIMTDANEFKQLDLARLRGALKEPVIFDARNLYGRPEANKIQHLRDLGFIYKGIGTEVRR